MLVAQIAYTVVRAENQWDTRIRPFEHMTTVIDCNTEPHEMMHSGSKGHRSLSLSSRTPLETTLQVANYVREILSAERFLEIFGHQ